MSPRFARAWPPGSVWAARGKAVTLRCLSGSEIVRILLLCRQVYQAAVLLMLLGLPLLFGLCCFIDSWDHGFSSSSSASRNGSAASAFSSKAPPKGWGVYSNHIGPMSG